MIGHLYLASLHLGILVSVVQGDGQHLDDHEVLSLLSMVDDLAGKPNKGKVTENAAFAFPAGADYEAINFGSEHTASMYNEASQLDYEDEDEEYEDYPDPSDGQLIPYIEAKEGPEESPEGWYGYRNQHLLPKIGGSKIDSVLNSIGFGKKKKKPKKKKKKKFLFQRANFNIHGGTRLKGQFKSLKACKKACEKIGCLGGDYDTKTYSCYTHSTTICDDVTIAHGTIHFSAVPCDDDLDVGTIVNAEIFVGMFAPHGVLVKKVKNILDCIKKCLNAGGGVASNPVRRTILEEFQLCFGIDYDIITHKCYLHFHYWYTRPDDGREVNICVQFGNRAGNVRMNYRTSLWPRLSSIHIIFCPVPD